MGKFRSLMGIVIMVALLVTACSSSSPSDTPADKPSPDAPAAEKHLRVRAPNDGLSLDPSETTSVDDWHVLNQIHASLLKFKPGTYDLEPGLATKYDISEGGTVFTLTLREGVQFHKGYGEMTSEDVKFSFERQMGMHGSKAVWKSDTAIIDKVEAPGKYTVKITLKEPYAPFLNYLANSQPELGYVVSKKAVEELGADYGKKPIGAGPFEFSEWVPRERRVLTAFADYYEGTSKIDKVTFVVMSDEGTSALALERGELDVAWLTQFDVASRYKDHDQIRLITDHPRFNDAMFHFNPLVAPLDNVKVRRAIAMAINYEEINEVVQGGFGQIPGCGILAKGQIGFDPSVNKPWPFNPEESKRLLQEAGVSNLKLTAVTYTTPWTVQVAAVMTSNLKQVGIDFTMQHLERAVLTPTRVKDDTAAALISWTTVQEPDLFLSKYDSSQLPPKGLNVSRYTSADDLISKARTTVDPQKRNEVLSQLQKQFCEDVPAIVTNHQPFIYGVRKDVKNFSLAGPNPLWIYPADM